MAQGNPVIGEIYRHYKHGGLYQVVNIAEHTETGEKMVVYQSLYGEFRTFVRPFEMFIGDVPSGLRFALVDRSELKKKEDAPAAAPETSEHPDAGSEILSANEKFLEFLDTKDFTRKYDLLLSMRNEITDQLIDNMAASLDFVIDEGPLDSRYEQLKTCVRTRQQYELNRFERH